MTKVYVSSTFLDLKDCREQVRLLLRRLNYEDVAMEYYVSEEQRPIDRCLSDVANCDLYIGIFAWRHGWVPEENNPEGYSITEMEYRTAGAHGKHRLVFLLDPDAPWPRSAMDKDLTQIERLRDELSSTHGRMTFWSAQHIGSVVSPSIDAWRREHESVSKVTNTLDVKGYFSALTKRYQRLDLDALTPPQKEEFLQLELRSVFVEQNVREEVPTIELPKEVWEKLEKDLEVHPDDLPVGVTLEDIHYARHNFYEKPLRPVLDVLIDANAKLSIILGDPGSGKSTLTRYILLSLIGSDNVKLNHTLQGYLPLLIELRHFMGVKADYRDCRTFLDFIAHLSVTEGYQLDKDELVRYLIEDGRAVAIFDGLDEIFDPSQREEVTRHIVGFASSFPQVRIVVTSRVIGYRRKILSDAGFKHYTLQDLDKQQVKNFIQQWYALALHDRPDEVDARIERITRSYEESSSIRQLAGNPMLLTIMAIIGKNQELPREKWKLYEHAASVLIQHWDVKKHLDDQHHSTHANYIGEEDKKELLRRLAYRMQGGQGGLAGNYIDHNDLQNEFEEYLISRYAEPPSKAKGIASSMLKQFRERNFILSSYGAGLYGFIHRAFLEFFCATAIVYRFEKAQEITFDQLKTDIYEAHWADESWHEVLRLVCGMISGKFAAQIIDYLALEVNRPWPNEFVSMPWNIALAVQCFAEVRNTQEISTTAENLLNVLCTTFDHPAFLTSNVRFSPFISQQILAYVQDVGSDWPKKEKLAHWLVTRKTNKESWRIIADFSIFVSVLGAGQEEVHKALIGYLEHRNVNQRLLAPATLAKGWNDKPQTPHTLFKYWESEKHPEVKRELLSAIGTHFSTYKKTLPLLRSIATNVCESSSIRAQAIQLLSSHDGKNPRTLSLLRKWANQEQDVLVQMGIIRSIALLDANPEFNSLLKRKLPLAQDILISEYLLALLRHSSEAEFPFSLFQQRLHKIEHWYHRYRVVELFTIYLPDHPETLHLLKERAQVDEAWEGRYQALHLLQRHYGKDENILSFLQERSRRDKSKRIRTAANDWYEQIKAR